MKHIAIVMSLGILSGIIGGFLFFAYAPLSLFEQAQSNTLGSTITTINASDTLRDSRAVINTNFSNLNTDKLESGSTAAALTITSSTQASSTIHRASIFGLVLNSALLGAYGGTGSTTLSANQVLIGNGATGVTTPLGWGTSGQFLTSAGFGAAPTWTSASVSLNGNNNWGGFNDFNTGTRMLGTTSIAASAALPLTLNTVAWKFPASPATVNGSLVAIDTDGTVSFKAAQNLYVVPYANVPSTASATTTLATVYFPANTLNASNKVARITAGLMNETGSGKCYIEMRYGSGSATTSIGYIGSGAGAANGVFMSALIMATSSTAQLAYINGSITTPIDSAPDATVPFKVAASYHSRDITGRTYLDITTNSISSASCKLINYSVEILTQ